MSEDTSIKRNDRKVRIGVVKTSGMDKSIVVATESRAKHSVYGKILKKTSTFMAHDENNECGVGDTVKIMETRPMSKRKRWRLIEVIEKAK